MAGVKKSNLPLTRRNKFGIFVVHWWNVLFCFVTYWGGEEHFGFVFDVKSVFEFWFGGNACDLIHWGVSEMPSKTTRFSLLNWKAGISGMRLGWCGISAFFIRGGKQRRERWRRGESFGWKLSLLVDKCRFTSSQGIGSDASVLDKTQLVYFLRVLSQGNLYPEIC